MRFRSFRGRLVAVFVGLFAVVLAISLFVVAVYVRTAARYEIDEELRLASTLFARQLDARSQQLVGVTRLLSGDFALKTAVATADHETTRSVLENHRRRIGADVLMLVSLDGIITADTHDPSRAGTPFALPHLLEEAEQLQDPSWVVAVGEWFMEWVLDDATPVLTSTYFWIGLAAAVTPAIIWLACELMTRLFNWPTRINWKRANTRYVFTTSVSQ